MAKAFKEAEVEKKAGRKPILARIDFDDERLKRIDAALYSIRLQLAQGSGFSFHTFDTAFIAHYKKTRPGIDIATAFPELFKSEREGMMDLIDMLDGPLSVDGILLHKSAYGRGSPIPRQSYRTVSVTGMPSAV
jgi:hypothetical protein